MALRIFPFSNSFNRNEIYPIICRRCKIMLYIQNCYNETRFSSTENALPMQSQFGRKLAILNRDFTTRRTGHNSTIIIIIIICYLLVYTAIIFYIVIRTNYKNAFSTRVIEIFWVL